MSRIYDNWEKLVAAVVKKEQIWQLFHEQSRSPSLSSESSGYSFSFCLGSSLDDVDFIGSIFDDFACNSIDETVQKQVSVADSSTSVLIKDQLRDVPLLSTESSVPPVKNNSSTRSRRRSLVIEVPKLQFQNWDAFDHGPTCSKHSPNTSPGTKSPMGPLPSPRTPGAAATPTHQGAGGKHPESRNSWPNDSKHICHPLPLPPKTVSPKATSISLSPVRAENPVSPGQTWKKGKLISRDTDGCVYVGFNSETGEMCAMKEIIWYADDAESKRNAKHLELEIVLLSSLRHPNLVHCFGSEMVNEKFCIYYEYVSGGPIHRILQEYGSLGELAIRSYTKQILSGLAYLHSKSIAHGDIKGATILVDPNGSVKLAGFLTTKHTIRPFNQFAFEGLPYWIAPEIIRNSHECNPAVDIWSLGCTVLEMATATPPWSQYGGAVALFKIGCTKELPTIPDHLSREGQEFVRLCLQRNPLYRPTAAQLLQHPFVKSSTPIEKQILGSTSDQPTATSPVKSLDVGHARNLHHLDAERLAMHSSRVSQHKMNDIYSPRNISKPVSPVGLHVPHPMSPPNLNGRISPQPTSSQITRSSASTAINGRIGVITYHHGNPSTVSQERFRNVPKRQSDPASNSPTYWDPDIIQGRIILT